MLHLQEVLVTNRIKVTHHRVVLDTHQVKVTMGTSKGQLAINYRDQVEMGTRKDQAAINQVQKEVTRVELATLRAMITTRMHMGRVEVIKPLVMTITDQAIPPVQAGTKVIKARNGAVIT